MNIFGVPQTKRLRRLPLAMQMKRHLHRRIYKLFAHATEELVERQEQKTFAVTALLLVLVLLDHAFPLDQQRKSLFVMNRACEA